MEYWSILLIVASLLVFAYFINGTFRIGRAHKYRSYLLDCISKNERTKIFTREGEPLDGFRAYDEVTFDEMVKKFWKPIDSFYTKEQKQRMGVEQEDVLSADTLEVK